MLEPQKFSFPEANNESLTSVNDERNEYIWSYNHAVVWVAVNGQYNFRSQSRQMGRSLAGVLSTSYTSFRSEQLHTLRTTEYIYIYIYIQSVPGEMCQTSGGCSLC